MEALSRLDLYAGLSREWNYSENFQLALKVNTIVLADIEPLFLSDDIQPEAKEDKDPAIIDALSRNIVRLEEYQNENKDVFKMIKNLENRFRDYAAKEKTAAKDSRGLFNQVINELGAFNEKTVLREELPRQCLEREGMNQVFLSHAYDDRLYAGALFDFFYHRGIYLYVDWMHHDEIKEGKKLKTMLTQELSRSEQLLFLRTINSELNISGKQYLRPWCSWELGNFYRKNGAEKYLINLYSVQDYGNSNDIMLHGLKLYTGTSNGLLLGREIIP